jgi:signal peptidase I
MFPTIQPRGEIVLLDRFTPRLWGLQGGSSGHGRAKLARKCQKEHESTITTTSSKNNNNKDDNNHNDDDAVATWYQHMVPVNELPADKCWSRLWTQFSTGVSVGDVVVLQHPDRIGTVCKRVSGLPGDLVTKSSRSRISSSSSSSPTNSTRPQRQVRLQRRRSAALMPLLVVPDGHIWVEGDNPWNSSDSRNYGPVPASMIVGRVFLRVWPLRGKALMERGARPQHHVEQHPADESTRQQQQMPLFSESIVLPAGYRDEIIVRQHPSAD